MIEPPDDWANHADCNTVILQPTGKTGRYDEEKTINQANRIHSGRCREYAEESGLRVRLRSNTGQCRQVLSDRRLPACNIFQIAEGRINGPVYAGEEHGQAFCRCMGGPAWFGYRGFDPRLPGMMPAGSGADNQDGRHLKESEEIACETYRAAGEIKPLGRYVVIRRCDDLEGNLSAKCIICFASGRQIRVLCTLAHFGSPNVFGLISFPWGPACATLVTYLAGMAEKASDYQVFVGPTDPSARGWLPEDCLAMGMSTEIARKIAGSVERSFLTKKR